MSRILQKLKCYFGFHDFGKFWKDGWIQPMLKNRYSMDTTPEIRICTFCYHTEYKDKE